jgi:hypothetical protein
MEIQQQADSQQARAQAPVGIPVVCRCKQRRGCGPPDFDNGMPAQSDDTFRQGLMLQHKISPWPLVALAAFSVMKIKEE